MIDKKEIILNTIIKEYLKNPVPVSSKYLQTKLEIKISPATIRNYFKKMVESGELEQLHISSGRVPAIDTLKKYWKKVLKLDNIFISDRSSIKKYANDYHIFCEFKFFESNRLKNVINYRDKFLILEFEKSEFILEFNEQYFKFFNEFKDIEISDLVNLCKDIGLVTLAKRLNRISNEEINIIGIEELLELITENRKWGNIYIKDILDGTILDRLKPGIYFEDLVPKGYMAYNSNAKIEEKDAKFFCIGALHRDHENFLKELIKPN